MMPLHELAKRFQFVDRLAPAPWRVPLRFHAQRLTGGLEPEIHLLPVLVPPGSVAIDVGANYGTYTLALSRLCQHVVAFEPLPLCAAALRAWCRTRNVSVHECALAEVNGTRELDIPTKAGRRLFTRASFVRRDGPHESIHVQTRTLDSFGLQSVGFLKIDVEGAELSVLRGAATTVERWWPTILVEVDKAHAGIAAGREVFAWLSARGYTPHMLRHKVLAMCDTSALEIEPKAYNFVFTHESRQPVSPQL